MSRLRYLISLSGAARLVPAVLALVVGTAASGYAADGGAGQSEGAPAPGTTIYVSPHGGDSNSGMSPGQAVATVARAQQVVRSLDQNMRGDITVQLESG